MKGGICKAATLQSNQNPYNHNKEHVILSNYVNNQR